MTGMRVAGPYRGSGDGAGVDSLEATIAQLGAEDAIHVLCQGVADVVRAAPQQPSRVSVRFGCASLDVEWPATAPVDAVIPVPESKTDLDTVTAPLVGTFYRAAEPGAAPFVTPGDLVEPGQQVAIIEAMKLMNPIIAEQHGELVEVLVADAQPVEYGQPLLRLRPPR